MMGLLLISVFILPLLIIQNNIDCRSSEEAFALLKWKKVLQNKSSSVLSSWTIDSANPTKVSPCTWFGISCNQDGTAVVCLNLSTLGLKGTLQEFSFSSFPRLVHLNLSFNAFFGNIPPQIGNLSKLQYLDLGRNQFSGLIPPEIGLLTQLRILYLDENHLQGAIPLEIDFKILKSLSYLDLSKNQLSGSFPFSLGRFGRISAEDFENLSRSSVSDSRGRSLRTIASSPNAYHHNEIGSETSILAPMDKSISGSGVGPVPPAPAPSPAPLM